MLGFIQSVSIFLLGCCFTFMAGSGLFLWLNSYENRLRRLLSIIFLFYAFLFLKDIFFALPKIYNSEYYYTLLLSFDAWATVGCALYISELLHPNTVNWKKAGLHLAPFALFTLAFTMSGSPLIAHIDRVYTLVYALAVYLYFFFSRKDYYRKLEDNYSYTIDIKWINKVVLLFIVYIVYWIGMSLYMNNFWIDASYYFFTLSVWIFVFIKGWKQEIISLPDNDDNADEVFNNSQHLHSELAIRIGDVMNNNQLFLNPKLTINDVATCLSTNRTYLSQFVNQQLNTSFSAYINTLRVEYARALLSDKDNQDTLDVIAEKSGFNSLSTFRRAFFQQLNCTPAEFRKNNSFLVK